MEDAVIAARDKVLAAFDGFIGNAEAVYSIQRSLIVAISQTPHGQLPTLNRVYLLSGPPSVGKTEIARRITNVLGVPFVRLDGRAVRSREKLFEMVDESLAASGMYAQGAGSHSTTCATWICSHESAGRLASQF